MNLDDEQIYLELLNNLYYQRKINMKECEKFSKDLLAFVQQIYIY